MLYNRLKLTQLGSMSFLKKYANAPLTSEQKEKVLVLTLDGLSMIRISKALGIHRAAIYYELERDPEFQQDFSTLRELANDELLDSLTSITDATQSPRDKIEILNNRLKSQNIIALVTLRNPKKYSPKLQVDHQVTVDLSGLLKAADIRIAPIDVSRVNRPALTGEANRESTIVDSGPEKLTVDRDRETK